MQGTMILNAKPVPAILEFCLKWSRNLVFTFHYSYSVNNYEYLKFMTMLVLNYSNDSVKTPVERSILAHTEMIAASKLHGGLSAWHYLHRHSVVSAPQSLGDTAF